MSGVSDLQAAVAAVAAEQTSFAAVVTTVIDDITKAIAALQAGGLSDSAAEALAQQLQSSVTALQASQTSLSSSDAALESQLGG